MFPVTRCLLVLVALVCTKKEVKGNQDLRSGGAHVCRRTHEITEYSRRYYYTISYETYGSCCHRLFRACIGDCEKIRNMIKKGFQELLGYMKQLKESRTKRYSMSEMVSRSRYVIVPYCCPGWAKRQDDDDCQIPICNPGCRYGTCIHPDKCKCKKGFEGRYCEKDINECLSSPSPCQQLCTNLRGSYACSCVKGFKKTNSSDPIDPVCKDINECETLEDKKPICNCKEGSLGGCRVNCTNTIGSFRCRCISPGFELYRDNITCIDVDECKSRSLNKCNQVCINQPGTYSCACMTGYEMGPDNYTCNDINECKRLHGGCNQLCTNTPGSFFCSCKKGYKMGYNKRTCYDINECKTERACDREHGTCINFPGTYTCGCLTGFKLQTDRKTCKDIDECKRKSLNRCAQNCTNTVGSYKCYCKSGFRLNRNGYNCDDVDECREGSHKCQQLCLNTLGSYRCNCKQGYRLNFDQRTCRGNPCQSLSKLIDGMIVCSGMTTDKSCTFKCNFGHQLSGSVSRTCLPTGLWSGKPASCEKVECEELLPPVGGSIILPCIPKFESTCFIKCNEGSFLKGSGRNQCYIKSNRTQWVPNNTTCKAAKVCSPNPCRNDGRCIEHPLNQHTCDCSDTGHIGKHCEIGKITVPTYPQLIVGKQSDKLKIFAQPKGDYPLGIKLLSDDNALVFEPSKLFITKSVGKAEFTITARRSGLYKVRYDMVSLNSFNFQQPLEDKIYASQRISTVDPVDLSLSFYKDGCLEKQIQQKITLSSTCDQQGGLNGFVSIKTPFVHLPVSIVGINKTEVASILENKTLLYVANADDYLESGKIKTCAVTEKCKKFKIKEANVDYVVKYNLFQRSFYKEINKILPSLMSLEADLSESYIGAENIMSLLGNGTQFNDSMTCSNLLLSAADIYSVYLPLTVTKYYFGASYKVTHNRNQQSSMAVNLINRDVHVKVGDSDPMDFGKMISTSSLTLSTKVTGFGYGKQWLRCFKDKDTEKCQTYNSYWKMNSRIASEFGHFTIQLDGFVFINVREKTFVENLSTLKEFYFDGVLDYQIKIRLFGDWLKIEGSDESASGYSRLGGSMKCPFCEEKGIKASITLPNSAFSYPKASVRFEPQSKLNVDLSFDIFGGLLIRIDKKKLQHQLRKLADKTNIPKKLESLYAVLTQLKLRTDVGIIRKYCIPMHNSFNILYLKSKQKESSYESIAKLLHVSREAADDCVSQLRYLKARYLDEKSIVRKIVPLLSHSKAIYRLNLDVNTKPFESLEQGKIISYEGRFCLHSLCLNDMNVTIYDLSEDMLSQPKCNVSCVYRYKPLLRKEAITIDAIATKEMNMSSRIKIDSGSNVRLWVDKFNDQLKGTINASVSFFDTFYETTFVIENEIIRFRLDNVRLPSGSLVTVEGAENLLLTSWRSLVQKITGSSSHIRNGLMATANELFGDIVQDTEKRLKGNIKRVNEIESDIKSAYMKKQKAVENLAESKRSQIIQEKNYEKLVLDLTTIQKNLDAESKAIDEDLLKRDLDKVCILSTCNDICMTIPKVCLCYKPVYMNQNEWNCTKIKKISREKVTESYKTTCSVTKVRLDHKWTGTCDPDPNIQRRLDRDKETSLETIGAGIGGAVGTMVAGPVGSVVGVAVGAVVGKICSWFSSCDSSMENTEVKYYIQEPCVKIKSQYVQRQREVSNCIPVQTRVKVGFSTPHQCKCNRTYAANDNLFVNDHLNDHLLNDKPCDLKAKDPLCISTEIKCQKKRTDFLKRSKKIPDKISVLYELRDKFKNNINASVVRVRSSSKRSEFYQDEHDRVMNVINILEQDRKYAKQKLKDTKNLFKEEICLLEKYKSSKKLLKIDQIKFRLTLPFLDDIELDIDIKRSGSIQRIPYIWQLNENNEISLQSAARKFLVTTMCGNTLYASLSQTHDLPFKPWDVIRKNHVTRAQITCTTYKKIHNYLKTLFQSLKSKVNEAIALKREVETCEKMLEPKYDLNFQMNSNDSEQNSLIKANRDLIQAGVREVNKISRLATSEHVQKMWREESEIITALQNLTVCLNSDDCMNEAFKTLLELPSMLRLKRKVYVKKIKELKQNVNTLFQIIDLKTLKENSEKTLSLISSIDDVSLHCTCSPRVSSPSPDNIIAEVDDDITMICQSKSELQVTWLWSRDGQVIDGAYERIFTSTLTLDSDGFYNCHASSLTGNSSGPGIRVEVLRAPVFIEEPTNVTYIIPSVVDKRESLVCNATSVPDPTISWFYSSFNEPNKKTKIDASSQTVLVLKNPKAVDAGFYHCVVRNSRDEIKSKIARVDVLQTALPSAHLKLVFYSAKSLILNSTSFSILISKIKVPLKKMRHDVKVSFEDGSLTVEEFVEADAGSSNTTRNDMLKYASGIRQGIANSAALLMDTLLRNNFTLKSDNGAIYTFLKDSMLYELKLNICKSGYEIHKNGYMCVQCPSGYAGEMSCRVCPYNAFAAGAGKSKCTLCKPGFVTLQQGSTSSSQCIPQPRCDQQCIHGVCVGINVCQCDLDWNGKRCENAVCRRECVHGKCIRPNRCQCKSGWKGSLCSEAPSTDIMILLDKSTNFISDEAIKSKIKKFIQYFMYGFVKNRSTRFGLITFDEKAQTELQFSDYNIDLQITDWVKDIKSELQHKSIPAGLREVNFGNVSGVRHKRIVIVLTNGYSEGMSRQDGFLMARAAALKLQSQGIHLILVCFTSPCQTGELLGVASYPKLQTAIMEKDIKEASTIAVRVADDYLEEKCFESDIDIGVLFKPNYYKNLKDFYTSRARLIKLFFEIQHAIPTQKIYFAPGEADIDSVSKQFQQYDLATLRKTVRKYHGEQTYDIDTVDRASEILTNEFDENVCKSYAQIKSLMIITTHPIKKPDLEGLGRARQDEVDVVNFVYDTESLRKVGESEKNYYAYDGVLHYVETLLEKKRQLSNCNKNKIKN